VTVEVRLVCDKSFAAQKPCFFSNNGFCTRVQEILCKWSLFGFVFSVSHSNDLRKHAVSSAERTADNSPALQCWESQRKQQRESVERTTGSEIWKPSAVPLHGLWLRLPNSPSSELLGYYHSWTT
jgi:hypothetical protein